MEISHSAFDDINFDVIFEKLFVFYPITGNFLLKNTKKEFEELNRDDIIEKCRANVRYFIKFKKIITLKI